MSKSIALILSMLLFFQSFGITVGDIVQIDELMEHAQFHNEHYGDNLFVFISKHYGELKAEHNKDHQEERDDHEQLPFQQQSQLNSLQVLTCLNSAIGIACMDFTENKTHTFFYIEPSSKLFAEGLFEPPRLV